jgi:hypothetical protein
LEGGLVRKGNLLSFSTKQLGSPMKSKSCLKSIKELPTAKLIKGGGQAKEREQECEMKSIKFCKNDDDVFVYIGEEKDREKEKEKEKEETKKQAKYMKYCKNANDVEKLKNNEGLEEILKRDD